MLNIVEMLTEKLTHLGVPSEIMGKLNMVDMVSKMANLDELKENLVSTLKGFGLPSEIVDNVTKGLDMTAMAKSLGGGLGSVGDMVGKVPGMEGVGDMVHNASSTVTGIANANDMMNNAKSSLDGLMDKIPGHEMLEGMLSKSDQAATGAVQAMTKSDDAGGFLSKITGLFGGNKS
jgi:hypothetical protein